MTAQSILLVPVDAEMSALAATEHVLTTDRINYTVVHRVEDVPLAVTVGPPSFAVVQGGRLQTDTLDALRRLESLSIPVLALIEELTDLQEATLLAAGVGDVVGLPTSDQRLRARVLAMQRHAGQKAPSANGQHEQHVIGDLVISVDRREVMVGENAVNVTKTEFELLLALARQPLKVLTHDELLQHALDGRNVGPHALESHLSRLRGKIVSADGPRLFESVRGVGYRLGP